MSWSQPAFENLARLVGERTGLAFDPGRRPAAEEQIRRVLARAGDAGPAEYLERLGPDPDPHALDDLIAELTVGETYFFREPDQFGFLRDTVLPEVRGRRGHGHILRAWSAGCASGEEAYSLAIVFREELPAGRAHLLATDLLARRPWPGRTRLDTPTGRSGARGPGPPAPTSDSRGTIMSWSSRSDGWSRRDT